MPALECAQSFSSIHHSEGEEESSFIWVSYPYDFISGTCGMDCADVTARL